MSTFDFKYESRSVLPNWYSPSVPHFCEAETLSSQLLKPCHAMTWNSQKPQIISDSFFFTPYLQCINQSYQLFLQELLVHHHSPGSMQ